MSVWQKIAGCAAILGVIAGCAPRHVVDAGADCAVSAQSSPPSAAAPTGPTAMNPPPGYPPMMNPTVPLQVSGGRDSNPIQVGALPSNMGYGGARTAPTEAVRAARSDCVPRPTGS